MIHKILVTGSAGYIGSNFLAYNVFRGYEGQPYDLVDGDDIRDSAKLWERTEGCSAIVHLAAMSSVRECEKNPLDATANNIDGTSRVAITAQRRGIPLVFASSSAAANPISIYGFTKRLGERHVRNVGGVSLRLGNVYGGINFRKKDTVITSFMEKKRQGKKAMIYGDGMQTRDFIHVSDVCEAILTALTAEPGVYEVASGKVISINHLATMFGLDVKYYSRRQGDIYHVQMNPSNWLPSWSPKTSLEEWIKTI